MLSEIYSYLDRTILYPLFYWKNNDPRMQRLTELEKNQYLPTQQLRQLQLKRLQTLIDHAFTTVPYYRDHMKKSGVVPQDIKSLKDIARLPVLSKNDILQHKDQLISSSFSLESLLADASGGSTGITTHYYRDRRQHMYRSADQVRHDRWSGWNIGDPYALIWGASKDLAGMASLKQSLVRQWIHRCYPLDAFELTDESMENFEKTMRRIRPKMVLGYANALVQFSEYMIQAKKPSIPSIQGVISSAESLTQAKREIIQTAFQCPVLNRYGSREVGLVASECSHGEGLHINADNVLVEILHQTDQGFEPVAEGEEGEIVVTDLWNYGMPFIRYRMGDIGRFKKGTCSCGRTLPLLAEVKGRTSDFFKDHHGKKIHGEYFTHWFYEDDRVYQFQLIQESLMYVVLKLVLHEKFRNVENIKQPITQHYTEHLHNTLGKSIHIDVEFLDYIPPSPSGKFLFTISKVS
ncbi:MAG: hypothetical protein V4629_09150 [Pseudomonadota bacterium]